MSLTCLLRNGLRFSSYSSQHQLRYLTSKTIGGSDLPKDPQGIQDLPGKPGEKLNQTSQPGGIEEKEIKTDQIFSGRMTDEGKPLGSIEHNQKNRPQKPQNGPDTHKAGDESVMHKMKEGVKHMGEKVKEKVSHATHKMTSAADDRHIQRASNNPAKKKKGITDRVAEGAKSVAETVRGGAATAAGGGGETDHVNKKKVGQKESSQQPPHGTNAA